MKVALRKARAFLETRVLKTRLSSLIWRLRHLYGGTGWLQGYKDTVAHPHRAHLADLVGELAPFSSLLEAGACVGTNLLVLARRYPQAQFTGAEINPAAVREGNRWLKQESVANASLFECDIAQLTSSGQAPCDLVLTDAALMYIGPEKIEAALCGLRGLSRKALLLNEWHCEGPSRYHDGHWLHDYRALAARLFPEAKLELRRTPSGLWNDASWDSFGAILLIKLQ